jgi:hypothetical protein
MWLGYGFGLVEDHEEGGVDGGVASVSLSIEPALPRWMCRQSASAYGQVPNPYLRQSSVVFVIAKARWCGVSSKAVMSHTDLYVIA